MRILFAGTPEFALPALDAVIAGPHRLVGALTQPDRPAGRGRRSAESPVKRRARSLDVPVLQPETLKDKTVRAKIEALAPDVAVVAAYGLLLPRWLLELPAHGCINVHASLLPRWRGAAPIARAILAGDSETGVTIMQMARGMDTGDVLLQRDCPIEPGTTAGELHDTLAERGGELLGRALAELEAGRLRGVPQNDDEATYAPLLHKNEAHLDWSQPADALARAVRAFNPWPVAFAQLGDQRVRIWRAQVTSSADDAVPGTVLAAGGQGIDVAAGAGVLRLTEVQWPGKRRLPAGEAARGRDLVGVRFG